jgi:CBS domain-containing protein
MEPGRIALWEEDWEVVMLCEDIMKRDVECLSVHDTVQAAAKRMREQNVGFLPICSTTNKVLGVITDRDIVIRVVADGFPASTLAQEVMTQDIVSCRPDDDLRLAEERMAAYHKSRILCLARDRTLVGVISLSDIAQCASGNEASETLRQVSAREARM